MSTDDLSAAFQQLHLDPATTANPTPAPPPPQTSSFAVKILAYADDTLVYLRNAADFTLLQAAVNQYMKASNALLNYHKTIATSLSDKPSATWPSMLHSYGITAWHDRSSPAPLTYLGYLICSSITQRNVAFQKLYASIKLATHIHSQRIMSIRGRVTILNSLIYSKLWHVLRLTFFTKAQMLALRGQGTSFINHRIFPRLSFDTLAPPRSRGGLGLLDPLKQQQALQWYWVCPLLFQYLGSPLLSRYTVPSLLILSYTLSWLYSSSTFPYFLYFLLFPASRLQHWFPHRPMSIQTSPNIVFNIQSCLSVFHTTGSTILYVDAITCLTLSLYEILLTSLPIDHPSFSSFIPPDLVLRRSPGAKQLLVRDVFQLDPDSLVLRVRSSSQFSRYPTVSKRAAQLISSHHLLLKPFFLQQCFLAPRPSLDPNQTASLRPFCQRILVPPTTPISTGHCPPNRRGRISLNSIRHFKKQILVNTSTAFSSTSPLCPTQWRSFWALYIPLPARTVWYRAIHQKIPTKSLLHLRIPQDHPSPQCIICSLPTETTSHFLFSCPPKLLVWCEMFHSYISPSVAPSDDELLHILQQLLYFSSPLVRDDSLPFTELSINQLFACTLVTIWQAHWRWIFDRTPVLSFTVTHRLARSLARLEAEIQLDS